MNQSKQSEIFRLAAVLYADNNYEVTPITIHRKIIESVFLDNNNMECTIHEVVDYIEKNYGFIFDFDEVSEIVLKEKDTSFLLGKNISNDLTISLTSKRVLALSSKLDSNNIDFFIDQFVISQKEFIESLPAKEIIYKFLYEIFSNNISSFSKLIDYKVELNSAIDIDSSFGAPEKKVINAFLQWDNDGKNKAIFDISSYALEFCLITNQNSSNSFHLKNLRNKDFYLDTNVLFRAIGINGENRKNRTNTFLNKFLEAGETLIISRFTEAEYKATVKHYIKLITKKSSARVNPQVFSAFKKESDFFDYYHKWRIGRKNDSIQLFESHVLAQYENLKRTFKIIEDYKIPFDEEDEGFKKKINELAKDIFSFKNSASLYFGRFETALTDAKNIFLINERRNGFFKNIFETKYFFISSDQGLRRWDFSKNKATPIVLLPSQWMSILLRYLNRTNDDFKSFVSFLNLPQNETNITNEKLQLILIGIGEITQDFEQQSSIVEIIINTQLQVIIGKNNSDDEIIENSRLFATSKLEHDLKNANEQNNITLQVLETHKEGAKSAIYDLELEKQDILNKAKIIETENERLKTELQNVEIAKRLKKWKYLGYSSIIGVSICLLFYLQLFTMSNSKYNLAVILANYIDSLPENSTKRQVAYAFYIIPLGCIVPLMVVFLKRFNKSVIAEKLKDIKDNLSNKH